MKKNIPAGLSGVLVLSLFFVGLVSACYEPNFTPSAITSVHLDQGELVWTRGEDGTYHTAPLTISFRPYVAWGDVEEVRWFTSDHDVVDFIWVDASDNPAEGHENVITRPDDGTLTITLRAHVEGEAYITARVTTVEETRRFYAGRMVSVVMGEDDEDGDDDLGDSNDDNDGDDIDDGVNDGAKRCECDEDCVGDEYCECDEGHDCCENCTEAPLG